MYFSYYFCNIFIKPISSYLIHSQSVTAGTDERDEPEGEGVRVGDEHLDEVEAAHQVHGEAAQDARCLKTI